MSTGVHLLSTLLESIVVDESGDRIGRVHDVRVRRITSEGVARPALYEVEGLIVGKRGLLVRLGWREDEPVLPWRDVVRFEPGRIVVRRSR